MGLATPNGANNAGAAPLANHLSPPPHGQCTALLHALSMAGHFFTLVNYNIIYIYDYLNL
jgi:hypothetical protein